MLPEATQLAELALSFFKAFATQALGYYALVAAVFVVVWRLGARWLGLTRVTRGDLAPGQIRREALTSLAVLATGAMNASLIYWLYAAGHTRLSSDRELFTVPALVASFVGVLLLNDAWFYGWHRLLHAPRIFRHVHAVHHRSIQVNPFTSYSFHVVESFVLGAWALPYLVLVPTYLPMLGVVQVVGLLNNINAHLGYELYPRWFIRVPPFRWLTTATYHGLHHLQFKGNYALFFRFWDQLFGTEIETYEHHFLRRDGALAEHGSGREARAEMVD